MAEVVDIGGDMSCWPAMLCRYKSSGGICLQRDITDKAKLTSLTGACSGFCVNGSPAGKCHLIWRRHEFTQHAVDKNGAVDKKSSYLRSVDGKFGILEALARVPCDNPAATGRIDLYAELKVCTGCGGAIMQFWQRYLNIQLNVFAGK